MDLWALRYEIYCHVVETGDMPARSAILAMVGDLDLVDVLLRDMEAHHLVVLDSDGEIRMALPFAATDTGHRVRSGTRAWWANCAWDSLAIPVALGIDAEIDANWLDTGEPVGLAVRDGQLGSTEGFVHFAFPAARWWDDIVET